MKIVTLFATATMVFAATTAAHAQDTSPASKVDYVDVLGGCLPVIYEVPEGTRKVEFNIVGPEKLTVMKCMRLEQGEDSKPIPFGNCSDCNFSAAEDTLRNVAAHSSSHPEKVVFKVRVNGSYRPTSFGKHVMYLPHSVTNGFGMSLHMDTTSHGESCPSSIVNIYFHVTDQGKDFNVIQNTPVCGGARHTTIASN